MTSAEQFDVRGSAGREVKLVAPLSPLSLDTFSQWNVIVDSSDKGWTT